jgi:hypothetical protein
MGHQIFSTSSSSVLRKVLQDVSPGCICSCYLLQSILGLRGGLFPDLLWSNPLGRPVAQQGDINRLLMISFLLVTLNLNVKAQLGRYGLAKPTLFIDKFKTM